ncbi:MAG: hypothetical protein K6G92_11370 [Bacteroidaceae bacterium]|nr:hypothetical protein [Bacteroidaceae bacterium]
MKTKFDHIRLTVETRSNSLPTGRNLFGRFTLSPDFFTAKFVEELPILGYFARISLRLKHGRRHTVSFNPEKNTYRITLTVDATEPDWYGMACDTFDSCLNFVNNRERDGVN